MTPGVRLYLVGSFVLVSLAGCGRGLFTAEREPWRAEAEIACLKSGAVRESPELVRISPISGPGMCGAEFPLKVAALGDAGSSLGFADDLRPPGAVGNQPRWPVSQPALAQPRNYPEQALQRPAYGAQPGPLSLNAPGVNPDEDAIAAELDTDADAPPRQPQRGYAPSYPQQQQQPAPPRLGPGPGAAPREAMAVGPVAVKPAATLACPVVAALDRWLAEAVQPAAQRWFGARVAEIKQISAYSCRGMNGNSRAHISEHAFGNALDIAAFVLADGRKISVKDGWRGMPEEQGFLRDVQSAACDRFNTVLAPGSNIFHYDHIHVDLMRRASRRTICKPAPVSGEEIAARANGRNPYAAGRDTAITGSIGSPIASNRGRATFTAKPGEDGEDDE